MYLCSLQFRPLVIGSFRDWFQDFKSFEICFHERLHSTLSLVNELLYFPYYSEFQWLLFIYLYAVFVAIKHLGLEPGGRILIDLPVRSNYLAQSKPIFLLKKRYTDTTILLLDRAEHVFLGKKI